MPVDVKEGARSWIIDMTNAYLHGKVSLEQLTGRIEASSISGDELLIVLDEAEAKASTVVEQEKIQLMDALKDGLRRRKLLS
jgi:hypothetical protein